jgi:hypothetical protein
MRIRLAAVVAVVLLIGAMIVLVLTHTPAFTVAGDLSTPLRPGTTAPLDLAIANPHAYPITVTSVSVTVEAVTVARTGAPSRCSTDNFAVTQPTAIMPLTIAPHAHVSLASRDFDRKSWPQIHMLKTRHLQDACKDVALTLDYHATGKLWGHK